MKRHFCLGFVLCGLVAAGLPAQAASKAVKPTGSVPVLDGLDLKHQVATGINYNDGPVMESSHNTYFIWYGNWAGNTATTFLPQLMTGLNGSSYFNTNGSYFDNSRHVSNGIFMSNQIFDAYSQGATLSETSIRAIVSRGLANGLPTDPNGVYFVLTSADVNETSHGGFCTAQCGYHGHTGLNGFDIKYAFVGNSDRCPGACSAQTVGPNGNAGADAMASVMAHELSEAVTDPDLNAWYDASGNENADKCAWNFGATFVTANGALANVTLGGRNFLLQQIWLNSGAGSCGLSFQTLPLCYQAHVQSIGWQPQTCTGDVAGTVHQSLRMEAITITAPGRSICYQAYLENIGWQAAVCDGAVAGTVGQNRRMEALRVWIQSGGGHVEYFGQLEAIGWTGPARDGAVIGTTGQSRRLEAVVIRILP